MTTVVREDTSRPPWPSCPANGWTSGVDALWGLPNGSPLGLQPRLVVGVEAASNQGGAGWLQLALQGGCSSQPETVALALGCGSGGGGSSNCTFVPNQDYAGGAGGPHAPAESPAECCALCAANPGCEVGVFQNYGCFFKTKEDAQGPQYKEGVVAAWPGGRTPPPPGPPIPRGAHQYTDETHGFYLHGDGYKTVNSKDGRLGEYDVNMPPAMLQEAVTGPSCPGTFSSEFGAVAISSWESLSPTLAPSDWGLHNAAMAQRNYAVDNIVVATANTPWPSGFDNATGELPLKKNLYFAMLGQALFVKSAIEGRKSANSFGVSCCGPSRRLRCI
jgi:beta-mannosidase